MIMKKFYFLRTTMMLVLMFASLMAYSQAELVAHYKLDETSGTTAADASGNGYDGEVTGTSEWVTGEINGGLYLSGDGGVTLPATDIDLYSDKGSVAFWLLTAGAPSQINTIFWAGNDSYSGGTIGGGFGPEDELHIMMEQAVADIWMGGEIGIWALAEPNVHIHSDPTKGTAGTLPVDPILVNDSVWHHVAATWGDGSIKLYIDGLSLWDTATYNPKGGNGFEMNLMYLGQMGNAGRTLMGYIDDVRIYDDVIDDQQVSDLFNKVSSVNPTLADDINLSLYPNPASDLATLNFTVDAGKSVSVNLYNVTGSMIGSIYEGISIAGLNNINLNTTNYSSGVYFVEVQIDNQITYSKLVIQ
jgi:hypothetical protein